MKDEKPDTPETSDEQTKKSKTLEITGTVSGMLVSIVIAGLAGVLADKAGDWVKTKISPTNKDS